MNIRSFTRLAALLTAVALAGCGAGGESAGSANGIATVDGNSVVSGTVTGFGSVYVEGVRYEDKDAAVVLDDDAASPRAGALSDLKLGMTVELTGSSSGQTNAITAVSAAVGPIASLLADGFVVAGQTVKVSVDTTMPTVFENVGGLSGLSVGDRVEVHGSRDAADAILASRIELKDPRLPAFVRVVGNVAGHDATGRTFRLGNLLLSYSADTRIRPTGRALADGQTVAIWSDALPVRSPMPIKSIVIRGNLAGIGDSVRVGGHIRNLDFTSKTFNLDGFNIDAGSATFLNGTASDLANGRRVRVQGKAQAASIIASEVRFARDQGDGSVELAGVVTDFVSNASFKVRGVPIDASGTAIIFQDGTAANLGNGVFVRINGRVEGALVMPARVQFADSESAGLRTSFGIVSNYSVLDGSFTVAGVAMVLAENARFKASDGSPASRADFGDQDRVRVRGTWQSGRFLVSEVAFQVDPGIVVHRSEGGVYEFEASRGVFRLNGLVVTVDGSTQFEGGRENLRNGVRIEVEGTLTEGRLTARKIEIRRDNELMRAAVKGVVTDFVSLADFRVAGQRVNASQAVVRSGSSDQLANGIEIEARGPVADSTVMATELRIAP